jgi:hypothetical protein
VDEQPDNAAGDLSRAYDAEPPSHLPMLALAPVATPVFAASGSPSPAPGRRRSRRRTHRLLTFVRSLWIIVRERPRD